MRTMRMAKGWELVGTSDMSFGNTETREEKCKREQKFRNAIRNLTSPTYEQMEEQSLKRYDEREAKNTQLLQAFNDKKLKSKGLIKKAKVLKKKQKKEKVIKEVVTA